MASVNLRVQIVMQRRLSFLLLLIFLPFSLAGRAEPLPEYAMKAAFIYNFTLFTNWPTLPNNTLRICTLESDHLKQELDQFTKKQPHGAKLVITKIPNLDAVKECQVLFLAEEDRQRMPSILADLEDKPILTITDAQGMIDRGVMIGIKIENRRIVFEVNAAAAKKSRLYLSSKLLSLAQTVY